jgi:hypothetical protein
MLFNGTVSIKGASHEQEDAQEVGPVYGDAQESQ